MGVARCLGNFFGIFFFFIFNLLAWKISLSMAFRLNNSSWKTFTANCEFACRCTMRTARMTNMSDYLVGGYFFFLSSSSLRVSLMSFSVERNACVFQKVHETYECLYKDWKKKSEIYCEFSDEWVNSIRLTSVSVAHSCSYVYSNASISYNSLEWLAISEWKLHKNYS